MLHVLIISSFVLLISILLCEYNSVMHIWGVSRFGLVYHPAMSIHVHVFVWTCVWVLLDKQLQWNGWVTWQFNFSRNCHIFLKWFCYFTFALALYKSFSCSVISSTDVVLVLYMVLFKSFSLFNSSHSGEYVVVSHCGFNFHSPYD